MLLGQDWELRDGDSVYNSREEGSTEARRRVFLETHAAVAW